MKLRAKTKCPKCGHIQFLKVNIATASKTKEDDELDLVCGSEIVYCDIEDGGCDGWYVATWSAELKTKIYLISDEEYKEAQGGV